MSGKTPGGTAGAFDFFIYLSLTPILLGQLRGEVNHLFSMHKSILSLFRRSWNFGAVAADMRT
jgi:hypothetical protein